MKRISRVNGMPARVFLYEIRRCASLAIATGPDEDKPLSRIDILCGKTPVVAKDRCQDKRCGQYSFYSPGKAVVL